MALKLTMTCGPYDRAQALIDGTVKRAGIRSPADLNGKRIGIQNWLTTAAVWARGLLEDEYGLDQKSVSWFTERMRGVGNLKAPAWLKMELIPKGRTQFDLLAAGEIDAG